MSIKTPVSITIVQVKMRPCAMTVLLNAVFLLLFVFFFSFRFLAVLDEAIRKANGEEIIIPFGVGIAGTVAQTKNIVNIRNAYEDPRFNGEIDQKTGYKTKNILSMPICNYEGDVIGVAQIINKTTGKQSVHKCMRLANQFENVVGFAIPNGNC